MSARIACLDFMDLKDKDTNGDGISLLAVFVWFCAIVAFSPAIIWLYRAVAQTSQLRDAVIILVTVLVVLAIEYGIRPHKPRFSTIAGGWLLLGYIAIFFAKYFGALGGVVSLAGFSCAIVALGLSCFDGRRYVYAAGGAFYAFTVLSFFTQTFDLPLRILAGKFSAFILSMFNDSVMLMSYGGETAQIALKVAGRSYLVATECNGFGIILGCIVLSIVVAIFRSDISIFKRLLIVPVAALFAYAMNSFRIVAIVTFASFAWGRENYHLMHETVGYVFFAMSLISVWQISRKI